MKCVITAPLLVYSVSVSRIVFKTDLCIVSFDLELFVWQGVANFYQRRLHCGGFQTLTERISLIFAVVCVTFRGQDSKPLYVEGLKL